MLEVGSGVAENEPGGIIGGDRLGARGDGVG